MNKKEAEDLKTKIISQGIGLAQQEITIILPKTNDPQSHGYQLHIKSEKIIDNIKMIKKVALNANLAVDESKKGLVIIYRPCFIHYKSQEP